MTDTDGLRFVVGWSLGGIVASALVLTTLLAPHKDEPAGKLVLERSLERLDQETCLQMMQTYVERSRSGAEILWLWAEESTPMVFGAGARTKQVVEVARPPRPYAFRPGTQAVPPEACSFPSNSLHVVSVETERTPDAIISDRIE